MTTNEAVKWKKVQKAYIKWKNNKNGEKKNEEMNEEKNVKEELNFKTVALKDKPVSCRTVNTSNFEGGIYNSYDIGTIRNFMEVFLKMKFEKVKSD